MMRLLLPLAAAFLVAASTGASAIELADYVGVWRGKGTYMRQTTTESSGKLTCRLTITAKSVDRIVVNGRCAAPEGSRGFTTEITDTGGGALAGRGLSGPDTGRSSTGQLGANGFKLIGEDDKGRTLFQLTSPLSGTLEMYSGSWSDKRTETADVVLSR